MKSLQYICETFRSIANPFNRFHKKRFWLLLVRWLPKWIRKINLL